VDYTVNKPKVERVAVDASRQSFGEQLRAFFRRNALWFLVAALAWLLIQDIFGTHGVLAMHRSQVELQRIQGEIKQLNEDNKKLQGDAKDLESDPATIEGLARKMGLGRRRDLVFETKQKPVDSQTPAGRKTR
jgi:cell division protein FtsB